jgi:hypothetical protein
LFEEIWTGYRGGRETCLIQPVVVKFSELLLPYLEANVSTITEDGLNRTGRSCGCSAVSAPLVAFSRKALDTAFPILLDRQKPKLPLHRPERLVMFRYNSKARELHKNQRSYWQAKLLYSFRLLS